MIMNALECYEYEYNIKFKRFQSVSASSQKMSKKYTYNDKTSRRVDISSEAVCEFVEVAGTSFISLKLGASSFKRRSGGS